jgi:hypothetical protein
MWWINWCSQLLPAISLLPFYKWTIAKELLFSQALNSILKGSDVLSAIDIFFDQNGLSWKNVVGVCTDGAPAMLGLRLGFVSLAKNKNSSIIGSYCVIHRQALDAKTLPSELKNVLEVCIKVVNTIKSSALTRVFLRFFVQSCPRNILFYYSIQRFVGYPKGICLNVCTN